MASALLTTATHDALVELAKGGGGDVSPPRVAADEPDPDLEELDEAELTELDLRTELLRLRRRVARGELVALAEAVRQTYGRARTARDRVQLVAVRVAARLEGLDVPGAERLIVGELVAALESLDWGGFRAADHIPADLRRPLVSNGHGGADAMQ